MAAECPRGQHRGGRDLHALPAGAGGWEACAPHGPEAWSVVSSSVAAFLQEGHSPATWQSGPQPTFCSRSLESGRSRGLESTKGVAVTLQGRWGPARLGLVRGNGDRVTAACNDGEVGVGISWGKRLGLSRAPLPEVGERHGGRYCLNPLPCLSVGVRESM